MDSIQFSDHRDSGTCTSCTEAIDVKIVTGNGDSIQVSSRTYCRANEPVSRNFNHSANPNIRFIPFQEKVETVAELIWT